MSKKSKKARKHKQKDKKSFQPMTQATAAAFLQAMKSAWKAGSWVEALGCYRSWTVRSGQPREPLLEAELLFRSASDFYRQGKLRLALQQLEEASARDPQPRRRYPYYAGVCLAGLGERAEAQSRFERAEDPFHREILSTAGGTAGAVPEAIPGDPVFERSLLLRFWKSLLSADQAGGASTALRRIHRAYTELCTSGGDPTAQLRQLEAMPGFRSLALHLRLLTAVAERSTVKVRNLIKSNGRELASVGPAGEHLQGLLDIHLRLLLKEQKAVEVMALAERFSQTGIKTRALALALNEARFRLSLEETERGNLESALDLLGKLDASTPAILHNRALLLQRLGRHAEAGEYWSRLLKGEKKPKRSDPQEQRRSYAATLRFVAENYHKAGELEEAFVSLKEACALDEENRQALASLQQVASELGRTREACEYARRLYEADPDNEESFYTYLHELMNLPDLEGTARLYREALERYPDNVSYRSGLAYCYLQSAWAKRGSDPEESERLAGEARKLDRSFPQLAYLEGLRLQRAGKNAEAEKRFRRAIKTVDSHAAEMTLGTGFYRDGMPEGAFALFTSICSCTCPFSDILAGEILLFLLDAGDENRAMQICELMLAVKGFSLYELAEMLREQGHPRLAVSYSSRLIAREDADEEDRFLHLLVLNELGERDRVLQYALKLRESARLREDMQDLDMYNWIVKQIKSRGRFKPYYE